MDENGFLTIVGRIKRLQLGGEMVSLGEIEALKDVLWPHSQHAAISLTITTI